MRRSALTAAAAALFATASAQTTVEYCDELSRCFAAHVNAEGIVYGFAIPEATAAPFDLILQITAPIEIAWAGVAFGPRMTNVPLIITWPYEETTVATSRVAYSYTLPSENENAPLRVLDGSYVNATHWVSTLHCTGCSSWADIIPEPPNSLDPTAPNYFGFVHSTVPVDTPEDPGTTFGIHDVSLINGVDFSLAQSEEFEEWAGGDGGEEPAPTATSAAPSTTFATVTQTPSAPAQVPIPSSCNLQSIFPLRAASGWGFLKLAGGLRAPRGMAVDTNGNLLIIQVGLGLTAHTIGTNGCISGARTLISRPQLTHGVALTPDGRTLYVSSATTVWRYNYNPATQAVSGESVVVRNMYPSSHTTRTLVVPPATPNILVVSLGSNGNLDGPAVRKEAGRAIVKSFDMGTSVPGGGWDYNTQGRYLGYGLRNEVALAVDPNNMVWGVENSADDFTRTVNGVSTNIKEENPAEELNYLGDPSVSNENWYGYPTCFTVWGGEVFPDGRPATGSQFIPAPNSTFNDATCGQRSTPPRLALQAHAAPIDAKFDRNGDNLFVTLHGSWNRVIPYGFKVVTIPFTTNAAGGYEPVAPANSRDGYDDILWDTQSGCSGFQCFRPSGLVWDADFTRMFIASDNYREGELYMLYRTS
ncbi:hypothetical protein S40285_07941 [Stachybotrys chlorohalonatus IBT 40285]|uniref:Uncharacterized protein n=1 Tax=Stachybotrys chlorohalonatus (strain IBT 40285) TaxID=1283841 RepID=A0A084Q9I4_STAC4|nr:hypothetical protein S40285_07941 [Stachybotrys chlorohalonata IBT 40285]